MSTKKTPSKKSVKKEARQLVYDRLVSALSEFKPGMKDKKFEKNLRRTSKLFAVNIVKAAGKEKAMTPKIPKKKTEPKTDEATQKTA